MGADLDFFRKKLAELQKKNVSNIFKPEEGETVIRIVPLKSNPTNPFIELYFHYNKKGKTYLSPLSFGEADPWAEFSDSLVAEGGLSKEEYKKAKEFYPTLRTYVPIVVRGKEAEGVKFWAFGKKIFEQLVAVYADEDYGLIHDVKTGYDLKITFTPQEKSDTNFAKTEIMVKPKQTPLTTDKELLKKLVEEQPDLLDSFKRVSYDELKAALQKYLNAGDEDGEEEASEPEPAKEEKPKVGQATPRQVSPSVEEEFNQIFDN